MTLLAKLWILFLIFFKIGLFSFGGGYVILPLMYQEIHKLNAMGPDDFSDIIAISQITPGPIALNGATYVGYLYAGTPGSIVATIAVSIPSFFIVLLVFAFLARFRESRPVQGFLNGIRPATVGLIGAAVIVFAQSSIIKTDSLMTLLRHPAENINAMGIAITIVCIIASVKYKISPITISIGGGILGMLLMRP